jgi:inosine/xanthosine triphosphatase
MKIIVGSKNPTKVNAVQDVFSDMDVSGVDVPSQVSAQPFSDEETMQGAINRATQCAEIARDTVGIGLEGGVMYVADQLYLCNWGALVTPEKEVFTASGARVLLPKEIEKELKQGIELGNIMDYYARRKGVSKKEGAIGIFTNDHLSRQEMFAQVVTLLKGQWEYLGRK